MTKDKLMKIILEDEALKKQFWPDEDVSIYNIDTLIKSKNKYLKTIHFLIHDDNINSLNRLYQQTLKAFNL